MVLRMSDVVRFSPKQSYFSLRVFSDCLVHICGLMQYYEIPMRSDAVIRLTVLTHWSISICANLQSAFYF